MHPAKRRRVEDFSTSDGHPHASARHIDMPDGVLDRSVHAAAIVQQLNCIGCDGRGLAAGVANTFPYGCSYKERTPEPGKRFAEAKDRAEPGTIDVRRPPSNGDGPIVINCFAQWELGAAGKYNRIQAPTGTSDTREQRERWFRSCLQRIGELRPLPSPIAFPREIGCGLAGGIWSHYEAMLQEFASAHPDCEVLIVRWTGSSTSAKGKGKGKGRQR